VEGVASDTQMEGILSRGLGHILVGTDTGSLESLRGQLLVLVGNQVDTEGEVVDASTLTAKIENPDLFTTIRISRPVLQSKNSL
jgi:hypothetical protein